MTRGAASLLLLLPLLLVAIGACAPNGGGGGDGAAPAPRPAPRPTSGDVLILGDSVMAWNEDEGASVADALRDVRGGRVTSRAVPGATLLGPERERIGAGYAPDDWTWVVVQGGANDLLRCGCGRCGEILDRLLAPDARSGVVADLVTRIRQDGAAVALWSYHDVLPRAPFPFGRCGDDAAVMRERFARLAGRDPGVVVIDGRAALDPSRPANYDRDGVHPSPAGSRAIAKQLARAFDAADATVAGATPAEAARESTD